MKNITGIVLAGGKSSRMGRDKGMIKIRGKTFIDHILSALSPNVQEIIIIANNDNYNNLGYKVYRDIVNNCGPLGGIYTGLTNSKTENNMIVSCDIPFINAELIRHVIYHSAKADIAVPVFHGNTQPLCAFYTKKTKNTIYELIKNSDLKIHNLLRHFITKEIHITKQQNFYTDNLLMNINTPNELKEQKELII